jgi:hypothetical protein
MPTLELPPVPFGRPSSDGMMPAAPMPPATPAPNDSMPSGSSIDQIIEALRSEPMPTLDTSMLLDPATLLADIAPEERPHGDFHSAVERRDIRERRRAGRETPDRRTFTSTYMAAPDNGPADPRPTTPPPATHDARPIPIDARMPELPIQELQPARPYELPSRGVVGETVRSSRASIAAMSAQPFPSHPAPPIDAPEPPTAPIAPQQQPQQQAVEPHGIEGIFGPPQSVGRLEPFAPMAPVQIPDAGPAGPAIAPGAGLDPVVATAAATPSAWFGGQVQVDEAMLVWNAPGATAPLAPQVAAAIAPQTPRSAAAPGTAPAATAAAAPIATTMLAPAAAAGAAAGASAATRSPLARLLRMLAWLGLPAGAGIGIAVALDHFLF